MKPFIYLLIVIGCLILSGALPAQISQLYRYEKEHKFNEEDYLVISLEETGLALVKETNKYKAGNRTWEVTVLDTALTERKSLEVDIDQRKNLIGHEHDSEFFYLLFGSGDNLRTVLDLVEINTTSGKIKPIEIKPELTIALTHFSKSENNFVFGGYVNNEPAVLLYITEQQNLKILPGFFQKETELVEVQSNKNKTFSVILIDRSQRDNRKLIFKIFDSSGKELLEDVISIENKRSLQTAIVSSLVRDDLILLGTWGGMNSKQSAGFYGVPVDPFSDQKIMFTAFGELDHYLDYLKEKKRKRIVDKTKAAVKAGRMPDYINYIRPLKMIEHPGGFLLLSEVFVPSSASSQFRDNYPYPGQPYPYPFPYYSPYFGYYPPFYNRMYDPFYYGNNTQGSTDDVKITRSVVVSFNSKGEPNWDQSVELDNIRLNTVEQVTDFCLVDKTIYVMYKKESDLHLKSFILGDNQSGDFTQRIQLTSDLDQLRSEQEQRGALRHWHDRHFYVWGIQSVRSRVNTDDGTKRVFYVNKIRVH